MKKYGNTNSEGLCTVKNPYLEYTPDWGSSYQSMHERFSIEHPELPLYTTSGHLVKDAENVEVELVWQYNENGGWITEPGEPMDDTHIRLHNDSVNFGFETRQIYLLTVPPTESDLPIGSYKESEYHGSDKPVFGQMDVMNNIIANKQSDKDAPMSSKGIKSADILQAASEAGAVFGVEEKYFQLGAEWAFNKTNKQVDKERNNKTIPIKDLDFILNMSDDVGTSGCTYNDTYFDSLSAAYGSNETLHYIQERLRKIIDTAPSNNSSSEIVDALTKIANAKHTLGQDYFNLSKKLVQIANDALKTFNNEK